MSCHAGQRTPQNGGRFVVAGGDAQSDGGGFETNLLVGVSVRGFAASHAAGPGCTEPAWPRGLAVWFLMSASKSGLAALPGRAAGERVGAVCISMLPTGAPTQRPQIVVSARLPVTGARPLFWARSRPTVGGQLRGHHEKRQQCLAPSWLACGRLGRGRRGVAARASHCCIPSRILC